MRMMIRIRRRRRRRSSLTRSLGIRDFVFKHARSRILTMGICMGICYTL